MHSLILDSLEIRNFRAFHQLKIDSSDLERLGVVVDADTHLEARWQSLRTILSRSGYTHIPTSPHSTGTIIEQEGRPRIGIWFMPNNTVPGILEDFVSFLVPTGDLLWQRTEDCLEQIPPRSAGSLRMTSPRRAHTPGSPGKRNQVSQWDRPSPPAISTPQHPTSNN